MKTDINSYIWDSFLKSVECEPRSAKFIKGASGYDHPILSVGVDDKNKRIVLISGEADARSAALAQGDIQTAIPNSKVLMVRPAAVNLGKAAQVISEIIGGVNIRNEQLKWFSNKDSEQLIKQKTEDITNSLSGFLVEPFAFAALNLVSVWKDVIQQLSFVELEKDDDSFDMNIGKLVALEPVEMDRRLGVCSIPLYNFTKEEMEKLSKGMDIEECKELLKRHNIYQYFYPAPDQLALGLADKNLITPSQLINELTRTPNEGHPFGKTELLDASSLKNMVYGLKEEGFLVEGDFGLEVTNEGQSIRAQVRFSPREGLIAKLSRIFSFKANIDLKDLIK